MKDIVPALAILRIAAGLLLLLAAPAAAAGRWTSGGAAAGFSEGGRFEALWFTCEGEPKGRVRLVFPGFEAGLDPDLARSVVVTVDDTAFRQDTHARGGAAGENSDLVREAAMADLGGLIAALKTGSTAEIASPRGRRTIALKGSGKALAALEAACR